MSISKINLAVCSVGVFWLSSCALKPITSEYKLVKADIEEVELDELGDGKILIYNGSDFLHVISGDSRLNVWIDGKALGRLHPKEYVIVDLEKDKYQFKVRHLDLFGKSFHDVEIDETTKVIKIMPGYTNKLTITNRLPRKFEKFAYMEKERLGW